MISEKVRNLGNWNARAFVRDWWRWGTHRFGIFSYADYNYRSGESVVGLYRLPFLLRNAQDTDGMSPISSNFPNSENCDFNRGFSNQFPHAYYWENPLVSISSDRRGSDEKDFNHGTITDNQLTLPNYSPTSAEEVHNAIKKMINTNNSSNLTADEQYVLAILRPNIMTSELYAATFIGNNDISFQYSLMDKSKVINVSNIDSLVQHYKNNYPGGTVSVEKGIHRDGGVLSVRFVVMNANRELVVVWLVATSTYSIHYKNKDDIKELMSYLETLHVSKKRTITRCYNGGKDLSMNTVTIDGRYQVHDEFYPMVQEHGGMNALLDQYETSTSNLLILAGQWGGGKSALFQAMCWRDTSDNSTYILVDDPTVYEQPAMFSKLISMIESNTREGVVTHLFLEEADSFIRDKRNNPFLSRLASLTAGAAPLLIKIVIATNDDSEAQIDAALTRGGRLFAMLKFSTLTPEQANTARAALNLESRDFTENVTLAEALTQAAIITGVATTKKSRVSMGF